MSYEDVTHEVLSPTPQDSDPADGYMHGSIPLGTIIY